jgi:hypothetical protein
VKGCGDGYRLANTVTNVCGAEHFSQSAATLKSGDAGLTEFWQRVIKKDK